VLASRAEEPQLFLAGPEMMEWSGAAMLGLREGYSDITSSQLSREQILQHCEHCGRPGL